MGSYAEQMPGKLKKENRIEYQHIYLLFKLYSTDFRESAAHSINM